MAVVVRGLALTPVKSTRLHAVPEVHVDLGGVRENRRFYLVDGSGRMLNGKQLGEMNSVVAHYNDSERRLSMRFPDGRVLEGEVRHGPELQTRFFSRSASARLVSGPWTVALSEFAGRPLRLVEAGEISAVDRGARGPVSLISGASLDKLAARGGYDRVDSRRFRMLVEVDGVAAHEEDGWVGSNCRVGEVLVRFDGHVGRCLITSRDPDTGQIDMPTLDILASYRGEVETTEPLPFGIYGVVLEPGTIRVGDSVSLC